MIATILFVFALVLFIIAGAMAQAEPSVWRNRLVCFGLACFVGGEMLVRLGYGTR